MKGTRTISPTSDKRPRRLELFLLALIVVAFAVSVTRSIAVDAAFEYDEASYATQARAWLEGTPTTGVQIHRAPLLPLVGILIAEATADEAAFRVAGLLAGLVAILLVWRLGRLISGPGAGLLAAAAVATSPTLLQRSAQFLTDVPATASLLLFCVALWRGLEKERSGWTVGAGVIAAAAFMFRFGSALPIVVVSIVAVIVWRQRLRGQLKPIVLSIAVFTVLISQHLVFATIKTGAPWGVVTFTARASRYAEPFDGLRVYVRWFPTFLAGPLGGILASAAIIGWIVAMVRRRPERRGLTFLVTPAVVQILGLGITTHAEPRFLFFPMAALSIAGAIVIRDLARAIPARAVLPAVAVLTTAVAAASVSAHGLSVERTRVGAARRASVRLAGSAIDARASDRCAVVSVQVAPITWYSRCTTYDASITASFSGVNDEIFLILFRGRKGSLPPTRVEQLRRTFAKTVTSIDGDPDGFGRAEISRIGIG